MTRIKIMFVDDEEGFLRAMEKRLIRRNIPVTLCNSGEIALKELANNPEIDVVILDVKMPVMDGIDTLREIKKLFPSVEVIMLTGHATFESALQGMKLGAFDYLMKPCDLEELLSKIEEAGAKRRRHLEKIMEAAGRNEPAKRL